MSVYLPTWRDEPGQPPTWHEIRELARQAETGGVDAIFVGDHSGFDRADGPHTEFWDGWTLLPALAEVTSRVALGPLVTVPLLRHPVALARMASALDEVSDGRTILALGSAGPIERAWRTLGIGTERRYSRFEEAIQIIVPLMRHGEVDFLGRYFEAHEALLGPTGPQGHAIPIWIGVNGPRMTRLAAQWADAINFNMFLSEPDDARPVLRQFDDTCHEVGRDPTAIKKTGVVMLSPTGSAAASSVPWPSAISGEPAQIAARLHALHRAGLDHLTCIIDLSNQPGPKRTFPVITAPGLEQLARVIDALRTLETGA